MSRNDLQRKSLSVTNHEELAREDRAYRQAMTPQERLDLVEILRLEAGKFLYEYPARLRRVLEVIRRK